MGVRGEENGVGGELHEAGEQEGIGEAEGRGRGYLRTAGSHQQPVEM